MPNTLQPIPTKEDFLEKSTSGNLIPLSVELLADHLTPVGVYQTLRAASKEREDKTNIFLLESVEGGAHQARYSFLALQPEIMVSSRDGVVKIDRGVDGIEHIPDADPLDVLEGIMSHYRPVADPGLPPFIGGAVGYLGYDAIQYIENINLPPATGPDWPDMMFGITRKIIAFDHVRQSLTIIVNAYTKNVKLEVAYDVAHQELNAILSDLQTPASLPITPASVSVDAEIEMKSNTRKTDFLEKVRKTQDYIRAGDIIQAVLSQRFEAEAKIDPLSVYRVIRSLNPSPYMFNLEFGHRCMVGASPEIHVRCKSGVAEVRPIAGTRPRGQTEEEDQALAEDLLADPKERAEHIMLVDLGRNDLGRVCEYGSVHVPELMVVEKYSHVMHIVSDVKGTLRDGVSAFDLMRATFPAGTLSGAPKVRAMEIIAEMEESRRSAYGGAVGYFGFDGSLDSCITIRTLFLDRDKAYVQAGAGIVADSDPEYEYTETCNKARSMIKALGMAQYHEQKMETPS